MNIGVAFWVIMILTFIFGLWSNWPADGQKPGLRNFGFPFLVFVLLGLLGWKVFGPALHS